MPTHLKEEVNVDYYGNVTVDYDIEDGVIYVNEVWYNNNMIANWNNIEGWLFADIIVALKARHKEINDNVAQYNEKWED